MASHDGLLVVTRGTVLVASRQNEFCQRYRQASRRDAETTQKTHFD
jgi:hypothetical protein